MRIISRYVLKEVFTFFSISLLTFTGLLLTVRMLRLTSLIVNRGVELGQIAKVFLAIIPTFLEIALPMATLLGVMLAFARMCGDSEMVVLRASGISLLKFLVPIGLFAAAVGSTGLFVSFVLRPWGFSTLSTALFDIARSKSTSGLTEGVFNKIGQLTLYAEKIDYQTGDLSKVIVDDKRNDAQRKVVVAQRGKIVADEETQTLSLLLGEGWVKGCMAVIAKHSALLSLAISGLTALQVGVVAAAGIAAGYAVYRFFKGRESTPTEPAPA